MFMNIQAIILLFYKNQDFVKGHKQVQSCNPALKYVAYLLLPATFDDTDVQNVRLLSS